MTGKSAVIFDAAGEIDTALSRCFQSNAPSGKLFDYDRAARHLLDVINRLEPSDSSKNFVRDGAEIKP